MQGTDNKIVCNVILLSFYQHKFHDACLQQSKCVKLECPLCRVELSPDTTDVNIRQIQLSRLQRMEIISAASRARNAVRQRILAV